LIAQPLLPQEFGLLHGFELLLALREGLTIERGSVVPARTSRGNILMKWGAGVTTLMALADILPVLDEDDRYLALFHGIVAVADDCEGQPPRTDTEPLGGAVPFATLARWFHHWVRVRHRIGVNFEPAARSRNSGPLA